MKTLNLLLLLVSILFGLQSCKTFSKIDKSGIESSMVKAMDWQEANPVFAKAPTDWTNGAYYTGVVRAYQATNNARFLNALTAMANRNNWQPWERFFHADDLAICYSYIYLKSIGSVGVNLLPTESIINDHLTKPYPWKDGTETGDQKILWWWCDALFMTPPVITAYSRLKNDPKYLDMMVQYYLQTDSLLFDKEEKLFARDLRFVWKGNSSDMKEPNGRKIFWSRGNGWVLGGLALMLDNMPSNYKHRKYFEDLFKEMATRVKNLQPKDGLWRTSLLAPGSYKHGEVSGSGFFTFAIAWGINHGILDKNVFKPAVLKAWKALAKCQQENGKVGWVQNIGAEPKPADKDSWQNYGTGAFLLAGSEVINLK